MKQFYFIMKMSILQFIIKIQYQFSSQMHLQSRYPTHSRIPYHGGHGGWDQKDYTEKTPQRFYYNYRSRNDDFKFENREQIPTFGGSIDKKTTDHYPRFSEQSYKMESNVKYRASLEPRNKYNMDNRYRGESRLPTKTTAFQNIKSEDSYLKNYSHHELKLQVNSESRNELERATEKKITNIDKINQKIKKILNTLNEQEKKIADHQSFKHSNKKTSFMNRIKTEGNEASFQNKENYQNLLSKYTDSKESYNNRTLSSIHKRNLSSEEINLGLESKKYRQEPYEKRALEQKNENFSKFKRILTEESYPTAHTISIQKQTIEQNKNRRDSQQNKKIQKNIPSKFLNGTNVKSTDSLNITANMNVRRDRQRQRQRERQLSRFENIQKTPKNNSSPYDRISEKYHRNADDSYQKQLKMQSNYESIARRSKIKQNYVKEQSNQSWNRKKEVSNRQKIISYQKDRKRQNGYQNYSGTKLESVQVQKVQNFKSFGYELQNMRVDKTPMKIKHERSLSKYDKSEKSCKLSNGKDLDVEIEKIQKKIIEFENIKKSFNMEDNQNSKKSRIELDRSLTKYRQSKSSSNIKNNNYSNQKEMTKEAMSIAASKQAQSNKTVGVAEFEQRSFEYYEKTQSSFFPNDQYKEVEINLPKPFKMVSKKNTRRNDANSGVKQIESTFMSEQRQGLQHKQAIKLLISHLCYQIELDTELRNLKKWYNRKSSQYKWRELAKELSLRNINTNEQQNKQIFTMTEEQDNPFFTSRDDEGSYEQLINSFLNSQRHWIDSLQHKFVRQEIQNSIMEMDIDRKGQITIEDMVRYINLQSDKYYRNRDLSLIYRRLSGPEGQVTSEYILTEFCQH